MNTIPRIERALIVETSVKGAFDARIKDNRVVLISEAHIQPSGIQIDVARVINLAEFVVSSLSAQGPFELRIVRLNNPRLTVVEPMRARLVVSDDECVAELIEVDVSISGASCTQAIFALREFIEHLFSKLHNGTKTGVAMARILRYLESHVTDEPRQNSPTRGKSYSKEA